MMRNMSYAFLAALLIATVVAGSIVPSRAQGQAPERTQDTAASASHPAPPAPEKENQKEEEKEEKPVVTRHQITVNGRILSYTATAGMMPVRDDSDTLEAHMFYVAYTLDGAGAASGRPGRPVIGGGVYPAVPHAQRALGSPLFLAGENYGATRAAGLSGYLMSQGIALNGIVLVSTVLNFQTLLFAPRRRRKDALNGKY